MKKAELSKEGQNSKRVEYERQLVTMLERRKPLELLFPLKGNASSREADVEHKGMTTLDRLRAGVMLARDAVKAVSAVNAGFTGVVGGAGEGGGRPWARAAGGQGVAAAAGAVVSRPAFAAL